MTSIVLYSIAFVLLAISVLKDKEKTKKKFKDCMENFYKDASKRHHDYDVNWRIFINSR